MHHRSQPSKFFKGVDMHQKLKSPLGCRQYLIYLRCSTFRMMHWLFFAIHTYRNPISSPSQPTCQPSPSQPTCQPASPASPPASPAASPARQPSSSSYLPACLRGGGVVSYCAFGRFCGGSGPIPGVKTKIQAPRPGNLAVLTEIVE